VSHDLPLLATAAVIGKNTNGSNTSLQEHKIVWEGDLEPLQIV